MFLLVYCGLVYGTLFRYLQNIWPFVFVAVALSALTKTNFYNRARS